MLSIATDYAADTGDPLPCLQAIAEAGFSHVHWCHHWSTDFMYREPELRYIEAAMQDLGLTVLDLHASNGSEKRWAADQEYQRLAGVDLMRNRIAMTAHLGSDVTVVHVPGDYPDAVRRSLTELEPFARANGVRLAVENTPGFDSVDAALGEFGPDFVGLCYDSGHGNLPGSEGLDGLERWKDRLIAVHLHDNDSSGDQHKLPHMGGVDWPRLTSLIAASSYEKCLNLEVSMGNSGYADEAPFLAEAHQVASALADAV
jgi:sugar phosphate isomerase/epimerase